MTCVMVLAACSVDLNRSPPGKTELGVDPLDSSTELGVVDRGAEDQTPKDFPLPSLEIRLSSTTNTELASLLKSHGASAGEEVMVVVPDGVIIGSKSVEQPAITTGDLASYGSVTLVVHGEIQGAGGTPNGGKGGSALGLTSPIRLHITANGAVRAGGGAGGMGGNGGEGNDVGSWSAWQYSTEVPKSFWSPSWGYICWKDTRDIATGQMCCAFAFDGGYVYEKGIQKTSSPLPILFEVRRASQKTGSPGSGGKGGVGRGYEQPPTDGVAGSPGTHRSGAGGTGGNGGAWGKDGSDGASGGSGQVYSKDSATVQKPGASGAAGGKSGIAIDGPGIKVIMFNEGTISGPMTIEAAPW